jgi:hypothetical protein
LPTATALAPSAQLSSWNALTETANKWIHQPDFEALRICLACVKALDIETRPVWVMIIGPSGTGKTAFYIQSCLSYPRIEITDQATVAGVVTMTRGSRGAGILDRLGKRGLWVFPDFTVILNMREDKRNDLFGVQRRICDGSYFRQADGKVNSWDGRVHSIAAATPAIERYYHANADLGQRYLQVRISRATPSNDLARKTQMQNEHWNEFQEEVKQSALDFIQPDSGYTPVLPFSVARNILDWADFIARARAIVYRNYKDEITGVAPDEGSSRVEQQIQGVLKADALLFGQKTVGEHQQSLIRRLAFDCLQRDRRAILYEMQGCCDPIDAPTVQKMSGITHPYAFQRAVDELEAVGAVIVEGSGTMSTKRLKLAPSLCDILNPA